MKIYKIIFLFVFTSLLQQVYGQSEKDTTLNRSQFFGGFGCSVYGYTPKTESYFSFYSIYGIEFNASNKVKYGISLDAFKFNWTRLQKDSILYNGQFDKVRYFSFSSDIEFFSRLIINHLDQPLGNYNTYIEVGGGYNLPYTYTLDKIKDDIEISEKNIHTYKDFYCYTSFYFYNPIQFPLVIKLEYHPFDLIKNTAYPEVSKFRLNLNLILHDDDRKSKKR